MAYASGLDDLGRLFDVPTCHEREHDRKIGHWWERWNLLRRGGVAWVRRTSFCENVWGVPNANSPLRKLVCVDMLWGKIAWIRWISVCWGDTPHAPYPTDIVETTRREGPAASHSSAFTWQALRSPPHAYGAQTHLVSEHHKDGCCARCIVQKPLPLAKAVVMWPNNDLSCTSAEFSARTQDGR